MKHGGYHDGCTLPPECGYHALSLSNIGRRDASVCYVYKQLLVMWGYHHRRKKLKYCRWIIVIGNGLRKLSFGLKFTISFIAFHFELCDEVEL